MEREVASGATTERSVTGRAGNSPGNGPFLHLTLQVSGEVIVSAAYETYQCPGCQACGKAIREMVTGKTLSAAAKITHPMVVERVGPLAKHRQICYGLALLALDHALKQVLKD